MLKTTTKTLLLLLLACGALKPVAVIADVRVRMASTTSLQNSGLFDQLLPLFEKKNGIKVDVIAVGTGTAIEIGKRGDADIVFVHAKELELQAVQQGWFTDRYDVMYNDFVVIGPPADPAKVRGMRTAVDAFTAIAGSGASFVSRGDRSGTHTKELSFWKRAGIDPAGRPWYLEVGQGMEKTQRIADEKRAYTLTDRGTWLATKDELDLMIVLEKDTALLNQYGVMAVNPAKHPHTKYAEAMVFMNWIISREGRNAIAAFRDRNGTPFFVPNAK